MGLDMSQFHGLFFEEAAQHLAAFEAGLARLDPAQPDLAAVADLHRYTHSIKGASASFGFDEITRVARALSDVLDRARKAELELGRDGTDACLCGSQTLGQQLSARREGVLACAAEAEAIVARLAAIGRVPALSSEASDSDAELLPLYDLRFSIARGVIAPDLVADSVLEQLGALGTVAVVIRPQCGGAIGDWRIGLRSRAPTREVRAILELIAEPGSLRVALRDEVGTAPDAGSVADFPVPPSPTLDRMEAMAREIRASSAQIAALAAQMEQLTSRHAVLLEEASELGRRFAREARRASEGTVSGGAAPAADGDSPNPRRRPPARTPVPKVTRSVPLRPSLADEWEEC